LIIRKISEFDATRCQISKPKCIKFDFRWRSALDPAGGAYSAHPNHLAVFKRTYFYGEGGGRGRKREDGWKGKQRGKGKGREREGRGAVSINLLLYSYLTSGYQNVS